ncbi:adenylate/guanylate cyclase domain-containing protein [Gordonia zhaorongruii]|uniref:adenylate/guanylate cyclase domain-containing protein n=1 Tax=Gordonia zhaorongruii TaxID=2597659 RepID=UPI00104C1A47|nr:adenylate/guanylate cyclase domain-containing protein [Gordonia zhaorongruii]
MSDEPTDYSRDEVTAALDLDPDYAQRFWNAFGFAHESGRSDQRFTTEDLSALAVFAAGDHAMDTRTQLAAARAIGQATARLAEWQADQIRALSSNSGVPASTEEMIDALSHLQRLVWRRHLDSYLASSERVSDTAEAIVGFADIVGYTSMSRRLGMGELEELLEAFESAAHSIVVAQGGRIVKSIGDAVMFTAPTAGSAAEVAIALHALAQDGTLPTLRIGMARGDVLTRMGDLFGEPVNIAARLASGARSGKTLIGERLAAELGDDERFYVSSIPPLSVRGYRRLHAWTLARNRDWKP